MLESVWQNARTPWRAAVLGALSMLLVPIGNFGRAESPSLTPEELAIVLTLSPLGPPPQDKSNAVSGNCQAIDFGRNLFFDLRLSRDRNRSCATCHILEGGFTDGRAVAFAPRVLRNTRPARSRLQPSLTSTASSLPIGSRPSRT
jgi:cytochrome c peroxidase